MTPLTTSLNDRILFSYWRSATSYRVRLVLELKKLPYTISPVNLLQNEHRNEDYLGMNAQGRLPALIDRGQLYTQSLAICEYLEETYPTPPLLPNSTHNRAYIRALCNIAATDIHPINNLSVLKYLTDTLGHSEDEKMTWYRHWTQRGLKDLENKLENSLLLGKFCLGNNITLAECFIIPQLYNAQRFDISLLPFPLLRRIEDNCKTLPAFIKAHPDNQPDKI